MATRIAPADIPVLYGMHTLQLRELTSTIVVQSLADIAQPLIVNLADFICCCTTTNIYYCCLPGYSADTFRNAGYFLNTILLQNLFDKTYFDDFKKVVRLFGIDTALLCFWIRYICQKNISVWPVVPKSLVTCLSTNDKLSFTVFDKSSVSLPTEDIWLTTIGQIQREFHYAGEFPLAAEASLSKFNEKDVAYLYTLLSTLSDTSFTKFPLCYDIKGGLVLD